MDHTPRRLSRSISGISTTSGGNGGAQSSTPLLTSINSSGRTSRTILTLSLHGFFILVCACLSCFAGGTMYAYGVWGSGLKKDMDLNQVQTNVLAGLLFSGGSFLTKPILDHVGYSMKGAALCPALFGAAAYWLLSALPVEQLSFSLLVFLMCVIGYSVMGLFICGVQAIDYVSRRDNFNLNIGTAIAQTSYGLGCMVWVGLLRYVENQWKIFCGLVVIPTALVGLLAFFVYPSTSMIQMTVDQNLKLEERTRSIIKNPLDSDTDDDDHKDLEIMRKKPQTTDYQNNNYNKNYMSTANNNSNNNANKAKAKFEIEAKVNAQHHAQHHQSSAKLKSHGTGDKGTMLVIVMVMYCIWYGSAIALESNSGSIMLSLGSGDDAFLLVLGFGVGQTLGRLSSLFFALWARATTPGGEEQANMRLLVQPVVGCTALIFVHLWAALTSGPRAAFITIALSGIPYGLSWTSLFHTLDAIFASDSLSIILGMGFGPGLGPLVMNAIVGVLYQDQIKYSDSGKEGQSCFGAHCYQTSYYTLFGFDIVALVLALIMYYKASRTQLPISLSGRPLGKDAAGKATVSSL